MSNGESFGQWVKDRRHELGLTQEELAHRVGCAPITIRKTEHDDLRPSVQIAERLAMALAIPLGERTAFIRLARLDRHPEPAPRPAPKADEIGLEDLSGHAIRGYALAERLGEGGMGVVYRATQPRVAREVAIKIILPQYANQPDFIRRFEAEAQLIARLEHPHIVPLYDYWREPGVAYLVMRLLRGGSVRSLLEHGALPLESVDRLVEQISHALAAAHRVGVVHRDLKPANILLDEDGNAYLADFGIAKNLGNMDDLNRADAIVGSPNYVSPEQIRSEFVCPQTDIYCLGVMLYELLTGVLPFQGPTPIDVMHYHLTAPLPPLAARRAGLPAALDRVIAQATAKDPMHRYPEVDDLLADWRKALSGVGAVRVSAPAKVLTDADNPYKGLRAFGEGDAADFFGRDALTHQLLARLGEGGDLARFLAVVGPSGCGKSSVVRAGLIPALRRGGLPGSEKWFIVELMPGAHPMEELEAALLRIAVNPPASLLGQLCEDKRGLLRAVRRCLPADPEVELVLVFDQFEELFTLVPDEAARAHLLDSLVIAALDERSRLRLVVTLRADFIDRPLNYVDFGEMLRQRMEVVLPFTPDELERAVTCPAERVGLEWEPGLVAAIMRDVGDQPGALPLLQYTLTELFQRRAGATLTRRAYADLGGLTGAVAHRAEAAFADLDPNSQAAARQLFLRLVTLGEGVKDTRCRVPRQELESLMSGPRSRVIDAFGKARLLSFDRDAASRAPTVEVAHEALLREWPRLRGWLSDSRSDIRLQRTLAQAAAEWQAANRDPSYLLTGSRLAQFEGWMAAATVALTPAERLYYDASLAERGRRESEERERQARLAALMQEAVIQKNNAEHQATLALARELAASANSNLTADPERSLLLAMEAVNQTFKQDKTVLPEAYEALHQALQTSRLERTFSLGTGLGLSVALSQDRSRLALLYMDGTTGVWDAQTGQWLFTLPGHNDPIPFPVTVHRVAFSPDGERLATGGDPTDVKIWDAARGVEVLALSYPEEIRELAFSPDGKRLAAGGAAGTLVWDAATGRELQKMCPPGGGIMWGMAFSPDGTHIATARGDAVLLWDVLTGQQLPVTFVGLAAAAALAFSPDGTRLAVAEGNKTVSLWDTQSGKKLPAWTVEGEEVLEDVAWSPDGARLATSHGDGTARIWEAATGKELLVLRGHTHYALSLTFSADGQHLATASADGTAKLWDITPSRGEWLTLQNNTGLSCVTGFNPAGTRLAAGSTNDGTAKIWDAATGQVMLTLTDTNGIWAVAFSPDGSRIATGADGGARVWDAATGKLLLTLPNADGCLGLAFSPDGTRLAVAEQAKALGRKDGKASVYNAVTGERLSTLVGHNFSIYGIAYSPDGKRLGTGSQDQTAKIWDATTCQLLLTLSGHTGMVAIRPAAFSPDSKRVATASFDGTAKVWDVATGQLLLTLYGHTGPVLQATFSPNGKLLATSSVDRTAKLWDAATGKELQTLRGHTDSLTGIAFSPDGTRLATESYDGTVRVWLLKLDDLLALARTRVSRELTPAERVKYLHETMTATAATPPITPTTLTSGQLKQVTLLGTFQSVLGCFAGDWRPACDKTALKLDPAAGLWTGAFGLPAGYYEYKVALNNMLFENYGLGAIRNGLSIPLAVTADTIVTFLYDPVSHWVADSLNNVIATVSGDFQTALGCSANWQTDCLTGWLEDPAGTGVYTFTTTKIPAGSRAAQVVVHNDPMTTYGAGGAKDGARIPFTVAKDGEAVTFSYNAQTRVLTIGSGAP